MQVIRLRTVPTRSEAPIPMDPATAMPLFDPRTSEKCLQKCPPNRNLSSQSPQEFWLLTHTRIDLKTDLLREWARRRMEWRVDHYEDILLQTSLASCLACQASPCFTVLMAWNRTVLTSCGWQVNIGTRDTKGQNLHLWLLMLNKSDSHPGIFTPFLGGGTETFQMCGSPSHKNDLDRSENLVSKLNLTAS